MFHETMGVQWQSEIFGKEKEAKQSYYGLNGLCTPWILCVVPISALKKRILRLWKSLEDGSEKGHKGV